MGRSKTNCLKCKYGTSNFWGYQECWKFNQKIDVGDTSNTAEREKDARVFNHVCCPFFEKRKWFRRY